MEFDALHLVFYVVIGLTALVLLLAAIKILYRNVPLWLFEYWPYLIGIAVAVYLFFIDVGWLWIAVAAGLGFAMGLAWSGLLDHCRKKGYEHSKLEAVHRKLVKWAQK